jgi:hypothetical protein
MSIPGMTGPVARNFGGAWMHRRRIIYGTLVFCAFCIIYLLFRGGDTRLNETIVSSAFLLAGGVIGSYVFGAVWDDKNIASSDAGKTEVSQTLIGELVGGTATVDDPDKP